MRPQRFLWAAIFSALVLSHVSGRTLYVSLNSTNPVPPYARWRTAATNIQDAINAASAGDKIWVNDGTYNTGGEMVTNTVVANRVVVNKAVTVQSVNGPAVTVIEGGGGVGRCAYLVSGATLSGFTLTGGFDYNNQAGGGVYCESISATVSNCSIGANLADYYGGGAYGGTLNNCTLAGNACPNGGGAFDCTLNNCTLTYNSGFGNDGFGGGACHCTLNNCVLSWNFADVGGGAIDCTLNNCTLTNNDCDTVGGGAVGCTLNNCTLSNNRTQFGGGAEYCVLNDCTLTDNSALGYGGGADDCTLNNCTLTGNRVYGDPYPAYGGGAYGSTLNNCTLSDNLSYAGSGGGAADCTLNNCTLTGNSAANAGGGADSCSLNNCIVFYNSDINNGNYDTSSTLNYCCTTPLPPSGVGNIDADPLFVDINGWSDLRLQPGSPCINAGNNNYVFTATDLDGNPRIVGGTVDMGAYEFQTPALLVQRLIGLANVPELRHQQPLLATLEAALASLQRGNSIAAANQLLAFQNKVKAQVAPSDPDLAQALNGAAQQVIKSVRPNPDPR